jgi:hypothetical protein
MNSNKQNEDKKNEQIFKNMAMTFSVEGVTKDIQEILLKKMNYHTRILKELNGIINALSMSKDKSFKKNLLKESKMSQFIIDVCEEYKIITGCTNLILNTLMKKKRYLDESFDPIEEEEQK